MAVNNNNFSGAGLTGTGQVHVGGGVYETPPPYTKPIPQPDGSVVIR